MWVACHSGRPLPVRLARDCGQLHAYVCALLGFWTSGAPWPGTRDRHATPPPACCPASINPRLQGNGLINLAYQLIAAKLNNAQTGPNKPTPPQAVLNAIAQADAMIGGHGARLLHWLRVAPAHDK